MNNPAKTKKTSLSLFTKNALNADLNAMNLITQKLINKYENTPISSQPNIKVKNDELKSSNNILNKNPPRSNMKRFM